MNEKAAQFAEEIRQKYGIIGIEAIAGDASTRNYWRADGNIVMVDRAEGASKRLNAFIDVQARLAAIGVIVPEIRVDDRDNGVLVMGDLGQRPLIGETDPAYGVQALDLLGKIQSANAEGLPLYGKDILDEELSRLNRFYLTPLGVNDTDLATTTADLIDETAAAAQRFVHVDYHAENILITERGLGLIDFQDARFGHALYDLVSFIDDVRRDIPARERDKLIGYYFKGDVTATQLRDLDWLGAQRLLKIFGIFARLYGEGRRHYAAYLPRCFALLDDRLQHPELRLLREWFYDVVPPWQEERFRDAVSDDTTN